MFGAYLNTPIGVLYIEANNDKLILIRLVDKINNRSVSNHVTEMSIKQLSEYFMGTRRRFDLPIKLQGTVFQTAVWQELNKIGYGETRTYSDIAQAVGAERAQRAVGSANRLNPLPIVVPCHRVVAKRDGLSGYAWGLDKKAWLLDHEAKHV